MSELPGNMLKKVFIELASDYTKDTRLINQLWTEVATRYSVKNRYYHTLSHLEKMLEQLREYREQVEDWDILLFSLYYHDIVYNTLKQDNEEKSAALAENRLTSLGVATGKKEKVSRLILATKNHEESGNPDDNLFIDTDLSILGQNQDVYSEYCHQIRKEYSVYPDFIYKPGRRKVLIRFLKMSRIFKTGDFFKRYEKQARQNLEWEFKQLSD